jgi:hypothetical protein
MHRLTARLFLTLMLVGTLAPAALAISAPAPHACCMRKPMHDQSQPGSEFHAPADHCQHDCCRAMAGFRAAQLKPASVISTASGSSQLARPADSLRHVNSGRSSHSGRAPPHFSIA